MTAIQVKPEPSHSEEYNTNAASSTTSDLFTAPAYLASQISNVPQANDHPAGSRRSHRRQRANARHKRKQREQLIRYLVDALRHDKRKESDQVAAAAPRRPRLVLLGNQKTLILGVVLKDSGATTTPGTIAGL